MALAKHLLVQQWKPWIREFIRILQTLSRKMLQIKSITRTQSNTKIIVRLLLLINCLRKESNREKLKQLPYIRDLISFWSRVTNGNRIKIRAKMAISQNKKPKTSKTRTRQSSWYKPCRSNLSRILGSIISKSYTNMAIVKIVNPRNMRCPPMLLRTRCIRRKWWY